MKKKNLFTLIFLLITLSGYSQIYNVFQLQNQDTLWFDNTAVRLPILENPNQCTYLIELDKEYVVTAMTMDIIAEDLIMYGWDKKIGDFHLVVRTNSTDQYYAVLCQTRYILVRSSGRLSQYVGLDFEFRDLTPQEAKN